MSAHHNEKVVKLSRPPEFVCSEAGQDGVLELVHGPVYKTDEGKSLTWTNSSTNQLQFECGRNLNLVLAVSPDVGVVCHELQRGIMNEQRFDFNALLTTSMLS